MPTWRGWLLLLLLAGIGGTLVVRGLHGFLAVHDPLPGGTLVIEGWSPDNVIEGAVAEFRKSGYERVCFTGGPIEFGNAMREHKTYAEYGKALCLKLGLPGDVMHAIPAPAAEKDRSYASALALRKWFREHGVADVKINIIGNGAHSRRTRLVYQKALGGDAKVGISNIEEGGYDPKRWWASSQGFRIVLDEVIAYTYARLIFSPPPQQP